MLDKSLFKKTKNVLEKVSSPSLDLSPRVPEDMWVSCMNCKSIVLSEEISENKKVCPQCSFYFRLNARERLALVLDSNSFFEHDGKLVSKNIIKFPEYDKKLVEARSKSGEAEAVTTGVGTIKGEKTAIFAMNSEFMMGSMGVVVGEKIARIFEYASREKLPVVGFTVSGGARMQEGMLSLMQMAKTSAAVKRHSDGGNLYVGVLTDPTTGGVTASFAMEADIILAEPNALIAFAGPRVIEQTINQKLPEGFQKSEFLLEKGFIDAIVERKKMRDTLYNILSLHK